MGSGLLLMKYRAPVLAALGLFSILSLVLWQRTGRDKSPIYQVDSRIHHVESPIHHTNVSEPTDRPSQNPDLACIYPKTDPFNPKIRKMYGKKEALKCTGDPVLTYVKDRVIYVNKTRVSALHSGKFKTCQYREVLRSNSDNSVAFSDWKKKFNDKIAVKERTDFIQVFCTNTSDKYISDAYYTFFKNDKNTELDLDLKLKKRNAIDPPDETLNVIMIGVDGTARNTIIRDMPKTYSFLTEDLQAFDMQMYSQVGSNTFPNYLALLCGQHEQELRRWWTSKDHTDNFDLVWDKFKNAGYRTLYTEDCPRVGGFHYLKLGFSKKPVQYYSRPLAYAVEKDTFVMNNGKLCVGDTPVITTHMNYVHDFAKTYKENPYFALLFNTRMTHDNSHRAGELDDHIHASLKRFSKENLLNNTLLIFFTDHGPRWGKIRKTFQGSVEGRSPIGLFAFPQWFVKKYPDLFNNFRINTKRLTSHFDAHATLLDIVNFKSKGPRVSTRHGISLFQEISPLRTCKTASIPDQFCLCGENNDNIVAANSSLASKLAAAIVKIVNKKRNKEKCAELFVDKILNVSRLNLLQTELEKKAQTAQYKVTLQTKPGRAQYTAIVSKSEKNSELSVGKTIIRVNMYRGTAECVDSAVVRPFCYCLNVMKKDKKKKGE